MDPGLVSLLLQRQVPPSSSSMTFPSESPRILPPEHLPDPPPSYPIPYTPIPVSDVNIPPMCQELAIPIGTLMVNNITYTVTDSGIYFVNCDANNSTVDNDGGFQIGPGNFHQAHRLPIDAETFYELLPPFHGSVTPVLYTLSGATVLAWLLLVLLVTSNKKRPWLQKFSTLALAALFTATLSDAVKELNRQYRQGYQDSYELQREVLNSISFEIPAVIVQSIMWLAHIQILLRIFVRRREVLLVKLGGGLLWILELIFWCVGLFTNRHHIRVLTRINKWALTAYAFEIVLVTTYAASFFIYSLRKRKYAYNEKTYIIALLSLISLIAPLVFLGLFAATWLIGWAVYCSLISNGAATVVLWDWLDAIEHFEKQEQRSGVMGRQVYEDDVAMDFKQRSGGADDEDSDDSEDEDNVGDAANKVNNHHKKKNLFLFPLNFKIKSPLREIGWQTWEQIFRVGSSPASLWTNYNNTRRVQTSSIDITDGSGRDDGEIGELHNINNNDDDNLTNVSSIPSTMPHLTTVITGRNKMQRFVHPVRQSSRVTNDNYSSSSDLDDSDSDELYVIIDRNDDDPSRYLTGIDNTINDNHNSSNNAQTTGNANPDLDLDLYDNNHPSEEPPNVFNRIPGFDPGDYWDDKAPPSSSH